MPFDEGSFRPVDRRAYLGASERDLHLEGLGGPLLLEGLARDWPAQSWSLDDLVARFGDRRVRLSTSSGRVFAYDETSGPRYAAEETPFSDAVMRARACRPGGPWVYLQQEAAFPEMLEDVQLPEGIEPRRVSVHLWLGPAGVTSPLHFDVAHNVFVQILGRKRFILVDPAAAGQLDPFPPGSRHWNKSGLDLESAEGAARLRAVASQTVVAEVGPGDALLLPALWWHHVETLEASLSLSFWWPPPAGRLLEADAWPLLRLLYERDRLVSLRQASVDLDARGGLIGLAGVALERGYADAAVLLAAAAVEARLRVLVPLQEPDQPRLVRDLPRLASRLAALGLLDSSVAKSLAERSAILDRVRSGEGRATTLADATDWVAEGTRLLGL